MSKAVASEDSRYKQLFNLAQEAQENADDISYDINPVLNRLRDQGPVHKGSVRELLDVGGKPLFETTLETYSLFSYSACARAFIENHIFRSEAYNDSPPIRAMGPNILAMTGEPHRRLRAASAVMFLKPKVTSWWRKNWVEDTLSSMLDRLDGMTRTDLDLDLFARLPMQVVTAAIGLEGETALTFREHLLKALKVRRGVPEAEQRASYAEVERMLRRLMAERRRAPGDDVISGLMDADFKTPDGSLRKLTDDEVLSYCRLIILAGGGTTWRQLGIATYALLTHYHFWEACRDDRRLLDNAVEEALRWNGTNPVFPRIVWQDVEIEGTRIPANTRVDVCLGAANRDPARWSNPDAFDIFRERKMHLSFGTGPHHCLGQYVARQELVSAISGLMDRFPRMRLDPDVPAPYFTGMLENRGMSRVPVILR
jgi:cytochrome P450